MKKKLLWLTIFVLICSLLFLTGCLNREEPGTAETVPEETLPVGAILPVMADEKSGAKAREIQLTDFTITLPEGYAYGKKEYEGGYTTYYVWQDKGEKEYITELDSDIMLYIYDGLDKNSPHKTITNSQAKISIRTAYIEYLNSLLSLRGLSADADVALSDDENYFTYCFTANSGQYLTTTYSVLCYPKSYYGIYALETKTETADRRFYGFIFSNNAEGEIFKESEYNSLLSQIKNCLNVSTFYTTDLADVSQGRSYDQLIAETLDEKGIVRGGFYDTLIYYVETLGRPYERQNVD